MPVQYRSTPSGTTIERIADGTFFPAVAGHPLYERYLADMAADATILAPPPLVYSGDLGMSGRLRTTDATPAEVYRVTLRPMTGYRALATLLAVDAGNGAVRMIYASIVAKRLGAGAVLVGAPVVIANHQDAGAAGWAITAAVAGNDLVIVVTGQAGRTIDWLLQGALVTFAPGGA